MIDSMSIDIQTLVDAVRAGGVIVKQYFGQALQIVEKTTVGDLRTKADTESEQAILTLLKTTFPSFNIYAEESGTIDNGSEYTIVIDPLDGTSNFVLGIPDFAISVGILKGDEAIIGVIYNPILEQLYTAEKDKGAFLNGKRIHVNKEADIARATVSYTCGYNTTQEYTENTFRRLRNAKAKRIVDHWAPAYDYCLLASGRLEAVISKEGDLEDYVAAKILVVEAGGKITGLKGELANGRAADFVATNGAVHSNLLTILG
jgi:myo-inositol-1(or 4)-monophosphatase